MSHPTPISDYDFFADLQKNLPQIRQYVRSIRCIFTEHDKLNTKDTIFTPFCGTLTYNYREEDGQIYHTQEDCATLESALQILGWSGVPQDLLVLIYPHFETRPFATSKAYHLLQDLSLFKNE